MIVSSPSTLPLGACISDSFCSFLVWAPLVQRIEIQVEQNRGHQFQMTPIGQGYFHRVIPMEAGSMRYFYLLDGQKKRPDPASRYQPEGVHGPSEVCRSSFNWTDGAWTGLALQDSVIYELHVGTFTPDGTFDAILDRLPSLRSLGINLIELMPIAQFPGDRNWGYDGVYPYAVQNSYGGPEALKRLVNACHSQEIGVALDVVYNHLGPEGNYLNDFGPYFTDRYKTPWGNAVNFDDAYSDEVRRFFIENALHWISDFHIDALRLDAIHAIVDTSAKPFLRELTERVAELSLRLGRKVHVIAENDRNDARSLAPADVGGFGLDSQWNDDFHHALHALVTGERDGYYQDFGTIDCLAKACREGFVYSGEYSAFRHRHQGSSSIEVPCYQFVVFSQNHDQVGNRAQGERLSQFVCFEALKLIAGVVLSSPYIPLLFMGEEYGERSPFQYFVSHGDPDLNEKVREGRRKEFEHFGWEGDIPDPATAATFLNSKLCWEDREQGHHRVLLSFYSELLKLRRSMLALSNPSKATMNVAVFQPHALIIERWCDEERAVFFFNFGNEPISIHHPLPRGTWEKALESSDEKWDGAGCLALESLDGDGQSSVELRGRSFVIFRLRSPVRAE
jgi:maltooligosyltrehalose trehalohydrolase